MPYFWNPGQDPSSGLEQSKNGDKFGNEPDYENSLDVPVLGFDFFSCDWISLHILVLCIDDKTTEFAESGFASHGKHRGVEVWVVLSEVLFLLVPENETEKKQKTN